jgi:hypothetical protein
MSARAERHQIRWKVAGARVRGARVRACDFVSARRSWRLVFSSPNREQLPVAFLVAPLAAS